MGDEAGVLLVLVVGWWMENDNAMVLSELLHGVGC